METGIQKQMREAEKQFEVANMLKELLRLDSGLSDNEIKWIEIFAKQGKEGKPFSPRQVEIIETIWAKHF